MTKSGNIGTQEAQLNVTKLTKSKKENSEEAQLMGRSGKICMGIYFILAGLLLGIGMYALWPTDPVLLDSPAAVITVPTTASGTDKTPIVTTTPVDGVTPATTDTPLKANLGDTSGTAMIDLWFIHWELSYELKLVLMVLIVGMVGSYVHSLKSFIEYCGNRKLVRSWSWHYYLTPFQGAFLALFFYFLLRAGMLTANTTAQTDVNRYGVLAFSALAGMFSYQAINKLAEIADMVFKGRPEKTGDNLENPKPVLDTVSNLDDGGKIWIVLTGSGFVPDSKVFIDNEYRECYVISNSELRVEARATEKTAAVKVYVVNPQQGGGKSAEMDWTYEILEA
jgi:hypothetical protein